LRKSELTELYDLLCKFESEYENRFGKVTMTAINATINHVSNVEAETNE